MALQHPFFLLLCALQVEAAPVKEGYASCYGDYATVLSSSTSSAVESGIGSFISGEDWTYSTAMCSPWAHTLAGSCYKVECTSGKTGGMVCKSGSTVVRVIDQLGNSCAGSGKDTHVFDLNDVPFSMLGADGGGCSGEYYLTYQAVNCGTNAIAVGGLKVGLAPNQCDPWLPPFIFSNVGGAGALFEVMVSSDGGSTWQTTQRNSGNGARWDTQSGEGTFVDKPISFKLTACSLANLPDECVAGETLEIIDALPKSWCANGVSPCTAASFQLDTNFAGADGGDLTVTTARSSAVTTTQERDATTKSCVGAYSVVPGDTLMNIAIAHSITLDELVSLNPQITDIDSINIGQQITIPCNAADSDHSTTTEGAANPPEAIENVNAAIPNADAVGILFFLAVLLSLTRVV